MSCRSIFTITHICDRTVRIVGIIINFDPIKAKICIYGCRINITGINR